MFNTIPEIIEDLKTGKMVIVMDDEGRENEGDVLISTQFIRPEDINFMAKEARGLICVPMEEDRLNQLDLRVSKTLPFGRARVGVNLDFYNSLNSSAVLTQNNNFSVWQTPTSTIQARFAKISVQLNF